MDSVKAIAGRVAIFVAMHHACPLEGSPCRVHLQARSFSNLSFAMATTSLDKSKIKFLLLEGIHPSALDVIRAAGYSNIETIAGALPDDELKAKGEQAFRYLQTEHDIEVFRQEYLNLIESGLEQARKEHK